MKHIFKTSYLHSLLENTINFLTRVKNRFDKTIESDLPFKTLSPTNSAENVEGYLTALDWAIKNKCRNVAISGPYGSGKSSIINTFVKCHEINEDYEFLNISLATFKESSKNNSEGENGILRLIELSILQQLFYHEKDEKIPNSRFKKIKNQPKLYVFGLTLLFFIISLALFNLILPGFFIELFCLKSLLGSESVNYINNTSLIIVSLGFFFSIFKLFKALNNFSIKKIGLSSASIEIDEKVSKSVFNNHIDEILYFFEVTDYNVVFIEDLDRFEQTEVFTKLREINLLINNSKKIERNVVFVYAIKDDMFNDKNRTKFFDFMIPIIPVINFSNSKEKILDIVEERSYDISLDLIEDISLFVDDLRLLNNIMNEYYMYSKKLSDELPQNKLLAMILYKNVFPEDFTNLGQNKGELYNTIQSKREYIDLSSSTIDLEINELKQKIGYAEEIKIYNLKELRFIYLYKLVERINNDGSMFRKFKLGNHYYSPSEIIEKEKFSSILESDNVYYSTGTYDRHFSFDFASIESEVHPNLSYKEREEIINDKNKLNTYKKELEKLHVKKEDIRKSKLSDLISSFKLDIETKDEKNKQLINVLLRNGYIDEDYIDYISLFHEGSLSKSDHQFLMNVKTQVKTDFDFSLNKKGNLIKRINEFYFEKEFILNYDILDYLLEKKKFAKKKKYIFNLLSNKSNASISFIDRFITKTSNLEVFIKELCVVWDGFWNYIETESNYTEEKVNRYFKLIIEYADVSNIKIQFQSSKDLISDNKEFPLLIRDHNKVNRIIEELNIKFTNLDEETPELVRDFIYVGNYYEINPQMVRWVLKFHNKYSQTDFETSNYSLIRDSELTNLNEYVDQDINKYLNTVFFSFEENSKEKEPYILELLNNEDVLLENKEEVIQLMTSTITKMDSIIYIDVMDWLLEYSKIEVNWFNLMFYYNFNENGLSKSLVDYINVGKHADVLAKERLHVTYPDVDKAKEFRIDLLQSDEINNTSYIKILSAIPYSYEDIELTIISPEKIIALIENDKLYVSYKTYNELKENFDNLHIRWVECNQNAFISDFDSFEMDRNDVLLILKSDKISLKLKEVVLDYVDLEIYRHDILVRIQIRKLIIENKTFKVDEQVIKAILVEGAPYGIENVILFNMKYDLFTNNAFDAMLRGMGLPYFYISKKGKRPILENNKEHKAMVSILLKRKYISGYKVEDKGLRINTFRK